MVCRLIQKTCGVVPLVQHLDGEGTGRADRYHREDFLPLRLRFIQLRLLEHLLGYLTVFCEFTEIKSDRN